MKREPVEPEVIERPGETALTRLYQTPEFQKAWADAQECSCCGNPEDACQCDEDCFVWATDEV